MLGSQCGNSANSHDQEVLHPLIDEQIIVREAITEFVDSTRLDTLRLLREQTGPATLTEISDEGSMSRQTVSSHIADFLSIGLVNHNPESSNYWLTAGGLIVLNSTERCLEQITREELSSLTRSPPPLQLLRLLNTTPIDPSSLSSKADTPSQSTIWRGLQKLTDFGWIEERSGSHYLLSDGEQALTAYEELEQMIEQCIRKAPFLQRLNPALLAGDNPFPAHALVDAELVFSEPNSPGQVVGAAIKLADPRTEYYRTLCSVYTPTLLRMYYKLVGFGMNSEGIIDASVHEKIVENDDLHYLLDTSAYDHYNLLRLEETRTLGIGLYDNQKIAVGAYNEVGEGQHVAVIISSNKELIDWGIETYNSYREQAIPTEVPML